MTTKKATTKRPAKAAQKPRKATSGGPRGNMKPTEIRPLAILARQAFDFQISLGNLDADTHHDAWRREQVMAAVNKPGLSACDHTDFLPVRAHFALLAGRDEKALDDLVRTGKARDHAAPGDTWENRRQVVHLIREDIGYHVILAETPEADVDPKQRAQWKAIQAAGGPIREGYALAVARNKYKAQPRSIDDLTDRLTVRQLEQLLYTIRNRIAAKEGRGERGNRNKSQDKTRAAEMRARALGEIGPLPRF